MITIVVNLTSNAITIVITTHNHNLPRTQRHNANDIMPIKWDDKVKVDLMIAMWLAKFGGEKGGPGSLSTPEWQRATEVMKEFGHGDATWTGISQKWLKEMLPAVREKHPDVCGPKTGPRPPPRIVLKGASAASPSTTTITSSGTFVGNNSNSAATAASAATKKIRIILKRKREEGESDEEIKASKASKASKKKD
ncbi:hypothetical protein GGR57DRAFT_516645 [Xylariaceae sp. FL1272]|nr:hypothetical protein GGR57DRAFT_516645 [Xylariaceae sp. FL1272]